MMRDILTAFSSASVMFRGSMDVKVEGNQLHLIGEAKTNENEIYDELTQGEEVIQQETVIALDKRGYSDRNALCGR